MTLIEHAPILRSREVDAVKLECPFDAIAMERWVDAAGLERALEMDRRDATRSSPSP